MVDKKTKLTELTLDYPGLVKIIKPYTFEYLTNDTLTLEDVAKNNHLDVEGFVKETKDSMKKELERNLAEKDTSELVKMIDETYFEDLLDELPVLEIYVQKFIKDKDAADNKEIREKFSHLSELTKKYIDFVEEALHPLVTEVNESKKAIQAEVKQREFLKDELLEALRKLREKTNHYVSVDDDIQFLYHRMNTIEDTLLDMILVEDVIYERAAE